MLVVLLQNGLDDVEPEAHAVLILAAGLVTLVEALKEQRDLLGGDGVALVAHGDDGPAVRHRETEVERRARAGELRRVLQQVVDDLRDEIVVAEHGDWLVGDVGLHVQPAVGDLLFH